MKLHEVFADQNVSFGRKWFRPVRLRGCRCAWMTRGIRVEKVPTYGGGIEGMTNCVADLMDDWEIVNPDDVLDGR